MAEKGASDCLGETKLEAQSEPTVEQTENEKEEFPRQIHGWKVADIQPSIIEDFGQVELLPWIGVGFALGSMFILPWGKIYGVFNIKWVYLSNVLLFEIGSAICGAAPNMTSLIIARVITGIGGCGMYSGTMTYVSVTTTMKERSMYMSGNAVMWGVGSVLGPVVCIALLLVFLMAHEDQVGGAFAISSATWRWAFYINLVIGGAFAPGYLFLLPKIDPQPGKSFKEKCKMVDWIMTVIFLAGCACFTMAISFGGVVYAWNSGAEITLWTLTGVLLILTILLSRFHPGVTKENRLYPAHFLKRPILVNMQLQIFFSSGIILGDGPLNAGIRLLPFIVSMVVLSIINGALMPKLAYIGPWHIAGSALAAIGSALMYTVTPTTSNAYIYGYTILVGAGGGCYIVAGFAIIQSFVSTQDIPNAVGAMTILQDLAVVVFLAVSGTLYQNFALQNVARVLPNASAAAIKDLIAGTSSHTFKSLSENEKHLVIPEITAAMRPIWLLFLVAAIMSFLLSLTLFKTKISVTRADVRT
ncbi:hypothetical protein PRK78_004090 [Emydomyces testavorans]|uniref:Major facilitator superfamily (MFS) profile domain-containing protein n=1 Tax=Emydomyces testavorans TaxID=2070801 RepID=A0AAF0DHE6_9EURO|nr:hypothetical protein PRK78_004090 [Emydomyces testavorans]